MWRVLAGLALLSFPVAAAAGPGSVTGRVLLEIEGTRLADLPPTVVFLDGASGPVSYEVPRARPSLHQKDARFHPEFLAIAAGQTVEMPNDDAIFHNVFSFSKPNDFDLGLYPAGQSRSVRFASPGVVKIYCSIHESMSATLFAAPSPWFAVVSPSGEFLLEGVPAGSYRLRVWNERLPEASLDVRVVADRRQRVDVAIAPTAP